jgi:amidophosphoribosyltransferase
MCGIVGVVGKQAVNQPIYDALTILQHRGQDAAGIVTWGDDGLKVRKSNGLVRDVFRHRHMMRLTGNVGIGHIRYPTAGSSTSSEAQPFYVNSPYGICLAHNGNLTNHDALAEMLTQQDRRHLNTGSDSEVLLNVFAHELQKRASGTPTAAQIFDAIDAVHDRCSGGYAVVAMIIGHGIVAFRDPNGIRPIIVGERDTAAGKEYMVASESVALDSLGFGNARDLRPGEAVFIENDGIFHSREYSGKTSHSPCIFEFVYFARPDSIIDNLSVYKARLRMGEQLIKNRYIGRTFIMPGQAERTKSVRRKLNAIDLEFRNKNVLLVDDSIVRGTTSRQIIKMAREAGARRVFFASAAPPVRHPNVYGIDMPSASELIANGRTVAQIEELIGADRLIYQDLHGLIRSVRHDDSDIVNFDTSCFSGEYVTDDVTADYLRALEESRSDEAKSRKNNKWSAPELAAGEGANGTNKAVNA